MSFIRAVCFSVVLAAATFAQTDWPVYGHDPGGMRFSPLKQINVENVNRLERAWTYHTGEMPVISGPRGQRQTAFETTPLVVNGVLYLSTPANRIVALEPESGRGLWKFDLQANSTAPLKSRAHRGVAYWPGDTNTPPRILFGTLDGRLIALNARTGRKVPGFGNEGEVDLRANVAYRFPGAVYTTKPRLPPFLAIS